MSIKDKVCIVTGATGGIGKAMVEKLVKEGAILVLAARRLNVLEDLKKELGAKAHVIGTGEMVNLIAVETKAIDVVDEGLTLKGLKMIYEMNS